MGNLRKVVFGLTLASGAFLAAWLLSGPRRDRTRSYVQQKVRTIKSNARRKKADFDDSDAQFI